MSRLGHVPATSLFIDAEGTRAPACAQRVHVGRSNSIELASLLAGYGAG